MIKKDGGSARKYRALGYSAHTRLPFGTFSHGRCQSCGKLNFGSRRDARRAAAVSHPGDSGLRPYRCPDSDAWHYGHIPEWKVQGYESAEAWRAARQEREEMAGRKINGQQRNALFTMRHRTRADLRALGSSGVTEAEMEDLASDGYVEWVPGSGSHGKGNRAWRITEKGNRWVEKNLP